MTSVRNGIQTEDPIDPPVQPLLERFASHVRCTPGARAVEVLFGDAALTYAELDVAANQVSAALSAHGLQQGDLVAVSARRTISLLPSVLGVLRMGGTYVPVDLSASGRRTELILERAAVAVVLATTDETVPAGPWTALDVPTGTRHKGPEIGASARDGDDVAYVLFTSGSTGAPKGVLVTDSNLATYLRCAADLYGFAPGGRTLVHSAVTFDFTVTTLFGPLVTGGTAVLLTDDRPQALVEAIHCSDGYDVIKLTPSHLDFIASQVSSNALTRLARTVVIGGEALHARQVDSWRRAAPATVLFNEYGPTEATVGCTVHQVSDLDREGPIPIGRPILGASVHLRDQSGEPVEAGRVGEIVIGGACVARGYLKGDDSEGRFSFDPVLEERQYRTGDLAREREDGVLIYLGRQDDQIKIRGHRVELSEVEAALSAHERIEQVAVVAPARANGDLRLVAYVVAVAPFGAEELRAHARRHLPDWMVPSAVVFVDHLPLNANGKIDRRGLPAPGVARPELSVAYGEPANPTEAAVARVWAEVLELSVVGMDDDFFELGGDSLLAAEVVMRANEELGLPLELGELFDHPTPRGWLMTGTNPMGADLC